MNCEGRSLAVQGPPRRWRLYSFLFDIRDVPTVAGKIAIIGVIPIDGCTAQYTTFATLTR
jgi:hypothetical protein